MSGASTPDPPQQRLHLGRAAQVVRRRPAARAAAPARHARRRCLGGFGLGARPGPDERFDDLDRDAAVHRQARRPRARRTAVRRSTPTAPSAVARAPPCWLSHAACSRAAVEREHGPARRVRSLVHVQSSANHSGRRCPSGRTGSLDLVRRSERREQVDRLDRGSVAASRPCRCAQIRPGSVRQPPTCRRCTAVTSQHVARRTPARASATDECADHSTHRGRSSASIARNTPVTSVTSAANVRVRSSPKATEAGAHSRAHSRVDDQCHQIARLDPRSSQVVDHRRRRSGSRHCSTMARRPPVGVPCPHAAHRQCTGSRHFRSTGSMAHSCPMALTMSFRPRHSPGHSIAHTDRHALERAGWRTMLEFRENVRRDGDGALIGVEPQWVGEAERCGCAARRTHARSSPTATGPTPDAVWAELRRRIEH